MTLAGHAQSKRSHADTNPVKREAKARNIERVLSGAFGELGNADLLDIGTGAGHIASHFAPRTSYLLSVDVVDERVARDFDFQLVSSELLPVADASFDVVISNHVIEHVDDQLLHLKEIARVLRRDGMAYLATPSKYALWEPHFRLPLLSWLPRSLADRFVRLSGRGRFFDVQPLSYAALRALSAEARLTVSDQSTELARQRIEQTVGVSPGVAGWLHPWFPSYVVILNRSSEHGAAEGVGH